MNFLNDPVTWIAENLGGWLTDLGVSDTWTTVILLGLGALTIAGLLMLNFILQTWIERKVAGRIQDRIGPNRVGPFGLLQPIADAIKMVTKEDTTPDKADKIPYNIAPILLVVSVILIWGVLPFASNMVGADLNVAVLYVSAVGSFGILAVLMAGWSSNNKYALLGAFRAVAQLVSYEVPLFLALLIPVLLARSMSVVDIVNVQANGQWFVLAAPLAFVIYFISSIAEAGRSPFDLMEAESEIVAGYHVEYSGMKFGLFQAGEFMHAFTIGALVSLLFFGGWDLTPFNFIPGLEVFQKAFPLIGLVVFLAKTFFFYFITIWIRLTVPRIRIDVMLNLNWKFLVPLSIFLLMAMPLAVYFTKEMAVGGQTLVYLGVNLVIGFFALDYARRQNNRQMVVRERFPERPVAVPPQEESAA